jgi:hypothetical protein
VAGNASPPDRQDQPRRPIPRKTITRIYAVDRGLDDVDECDLYVLILGHRYGFQPAEDTPDSLSITQLEFRRAGERGIPRVALLRTSIPDVRLSDLQDPARAALVWAFRAEVERDVRPAQFSDEGGLIRGLSTGVQGELEKQSITPAGAGGRAPVSWPCRVGVVPGQADCFQRRGAAASPSRPTANCAAATRTRRSGHWNRPNPGTRRAHGRARLASRTARTAAHVR